MHEIHEIEKKLRQDAQKISKRHGGAPVVIILGAYREADTDIRRCMTASTLQGYRLRDLLGILQTAIQIETLKHFQLFP
jgi:hypothetical protein